MKNNYFKLKIDNPCNQVWDDMESNNNGKFCSNCQKNVIDFTYKSKGQIALFFEENNNHVCGRFLTIQLEEYYEPSLFKVRKNPLKLIVSFFLLLTAKLLNSGASIQPKIKNQLAYFVESKNEIKHNGFEKQTDNLIIRGILIDSFNNEKIPYASVRIQNTKTGIRTDSEGNFKFPIPDSLISDIIVLETSVLGRNKCIKSYNINELKNPITFLFNSDKSPFIQGGIGIKLSDKKIDTI